MRRSSKELPKDPNQLAYKIVKISTEEKEENRSAVSKYLAEIGQRGGLKGGKARAKKLSPQARSKIARKAAISRWSRRDEER